MSILQAFIAGKEARRTADAAAEMNRMQQFLAQNGQAIFQGDQNALGQLAGMGAQGLETAMNLRTANDQRAAAEAERARAGVVDQRADQEWKWKVEERAASLDAATRDAERAQLAEGLAGAAYFHAQGDQQGYNDFLTQNGIDPAQFPFEAFPAHAARFKEVLEVYDRFKPQTPEPADEYQRYVQEETAAGRQPLDRIGFERAIKSKGNAFSVTTPDGTQINYGDAGATGLPPVGQNAAETGTPRDGQRLARNLSDQDATTLKEEMDRARAAEDLESLAGQMKMLLPDVGYTGFGGGAYGVADSIFMDALPGDGAARGSFQSLAVDAQLTFIAKTKGAVTDQEMALFRSAVPGLGQSPQANQMIADILSAGARRVQTRAKFMEEYAARNGSLEGSKAAWDRYMQENPLMERGESGIVLNEEGNYSSYLDKQSAPVNRAPTVIDGFEIEEVN